MPQNTVNMTLFCDHGAQKFFFPRESMFPLHELSLQLGLVIACEDFYFYFFFYLFIFLTKTCLRGCPHGVMVKALDCRLVVSKFKLYSCYYVHFWTNTLGKDMNPLILPAMG